MQKSEKGLAKTALTVYNNNMEIAAIPRRILPDSSYYSISSAKNQEEMRFLHKNTMKARNSMETEFQNAAGKGIGEVMRDIADFLSTPCVIHRERKIDLRFLTPELNMAEQFSYALLSEAALQGWDPEKAENFYRHACGPALQDEVIDRISNAFRNPEGEEFRALRKRYGNRFSLLDGSYWSCVLAVGIDAGQVDEVMRYLRLFIVCLMEFAYMEDRNPQSTYAWCYYESFRQMLDDLTAEPEPEPLPLKVRALGGSAGAREGDSYMLSLGVDIENPNPDRMARGIGVDVTLKDKSGAVITVIGDRLESLDPGAIYHYGVTRKIRGAAVASISVTAKASSHLKLTTPIMKHVRLTEPRLVRTGEKMKFSGRIVGEYDRPLRSMTLHYQFLSAENKILGGGSEWILDGLLPGEPRTVASEIPVPIKNAAKAVYSIDFDAIDLVTD